MVRWRQNGQPHAEHVSFGWALMSTFMGGVVLGGNYTKIIHRDANCGALKVCAESRSMSCKLLSLLPKDIEMHTLATNPERP